MSKTLLLSPQRQTNGVNTPRGIITIDCSRGLLSGKLRTYNLVINTTEVVVAVFHNGKVEKAFLKPIERGAYIFNLAGDFDDLTDLYFALVWAKDILLSGGLIANSIADIESLLNQGEGQDYDEESEKDVEQYFMQQENIAHIENIETSANISAPDAMSYIDNVNLDMSDEQVYPIPNGVASETKDIEEEDVSTNDTKNANKEGKVEDFFSSISEQVDELLAKYPEDEQLNAIVPDAKFIKIENNESSESYILGVIYQDGEMRYLAYGVPSNYDSEPPEELKGKCQWLPVDPSDPLTDGYYVIYQDTKSGELVNIDIV